MFCSLSVLAGKPTEREEEGDKRGPGCNLCLLESGRLALVYCPLSNLKWGPPGSYGGPLSKAERKILRLPLQKRK